MCLIISGKVLFTIDGLALDQIIIVLASQESIAITSDDTFNIAAKPSDIDIMKKWQGSYPF